MNKRIDQLWGQALDRAVPDTYSSLSWTQVEKIKAVFAELIVRECASVIEKNHPEFTCKEDADNLYRKAGRMDAIDEIKQHFGVEE